MINQTKNDIDGLDEALTSLHRTMSQRHMWSHITARAGVSIDRTGAIIIKLLAESDGRCRPSEIAERIGVEAPSVTRKVQQLEEAGLVARRIDAKDHRVSHLHATPAGVKILKHLGKAKRQYLAAVIAKWPAKDRREIATLCQRLAKDMAGQNYKSTSHK